ncbi:MAG: hypothetical protein KF832_06665 [Caldilineaceae bacterium]|nr:hypothetical protein [Caldilineaceae bacterium]
MLYWRDGWLWTAGLISSGLLLLTWNLGLFVAYEPWPQYSLTLLLGSVGVTFFGGYVTAPAQWWRLIPGWTMVALALMLLLSTLPEPPMRLIAALLFWGLGVAFVQIYWTQRIEHWWAIIPGGFMLVLGCIIAISGVVTDLEILSALLFTGMGAVFYLLYLLSRQTRQWWALIPASVLSLFGILVAVAQVGTGTSAMRWWPLLLILLGLFIGWRTAQTPAPPREPLRLPSLMLPTRWRWPAAPSVDSADAVAKPTAQPPSPASTETVPASHERT